MTFLNRLDFRNLNYSGCEYPNFIINCFTDVSLKFTFFKKKFTLPYKLYAYRFYLV